MKKNFFLLTCLIYLTCNIAYPQSIDSAVVEHKIVVYSGFIDSAKTISIKKTQVFDVVVNDSFLIKEKYVIDTFLTVYIFYAFETEKINQILISGDCFAFLLDNEGSEEFYRAYIPYNKFKIEFTIYRALTNGKSKACNDGDLWDIEMNNRINTNITSDKRALICIKLKKE